jgi:drug/metabolite transporter (DMT)-like permease
VPASIHPPSSLGRGYAAALSAAAVLSLTAIFIRHLTQTYHIPSLVLAFWRDAFVVVTLLPVLALFRPALLKPGKARETTEVVTTLHEERETSEILTTLHKARETTEVVTTRPYLYLFGYGFILALFNSLWTLSVVLNGAAVATVLAYCSTAFTALLGRWLLKERLGWGKLLAIVLSLAGCALVSGALQPSVWQTNLMGILTGILSGLLYAIYSLMGRSASQRGLNPWTTLLYSFGFAAVFLLAFNFIPGGFLPGAATHPAELLWLGTAWAGWGVLLLLAAGPTVIGFGLYMVSLSILPSSVANLIVTLEPAFTAVIAYFAFGERMNGMQTAGSLMILAGVVVLRLTERRS